MLEVVFFQSSTATVKNITGKLSCQNLDVVSLKSLKEGDSLLFDCKNLKFLKKKEKMMRALHKSKFQITVQSAQILLKREIISLHREIMPLLIFVQ